MTQIFDIESIWTRTNDGPFEESDLGKTLSDLPNLHVNGPWLGGGALRRTLVGAGLDSDYDFFFRDADQLNKFVEALQKKGLVKVKETEHHVQLRGAVGESKIPIDVQCIRFRYYATATEVINSFDFTICQFAFDGHKLTCGDYALWDLGRKKLVINKVTYPVATMRRVLKYTRQGFTACSGCLATILRETASSPELQQQLDIQYVD